jgi:pre-rRNA-processing protein IPI1
MLFVTSAQTNIFPAIRIDAVRILNILLELTPDLVVQNWTAPESTGSRVLEGFLGLLSVGSAYWKTNKGDELQLV